MKKLPAVDRIRCALVSKSWAELLGRAPIWAHVSFEDATSASLDDRTLLSLLRRSQGELRCLDLSHPSCARVGLYLDGKPLLGVLAAEGLTAKLESLATTGGSPFTVCDASAARQLLASCPALTSTAVSLDGEWREVAAAMLVLPGARKGCSVALQGPPTYEADPLFPAFSSALRAGLAHCAVERLVFQERGLRRPGAAAGASGDPGAAAAAEKLAAALADPRTGPAELCSFGSCVVPVLSRLCRALTPESPLRRLLLCQAGGNIHALTDNGGEAAAALGAALAPGRSRLDTLEILGGHDARVWCARVYACVARAYWWRTHWWHASSFLAGQQCQPSL